MAGRKKVPTSLKIMRGTNRRDRENPDEPRPRVLPGMEPPDWLEDEVARDVWAATVPVLERTGVLTEADVDALAGYCTAMSHLRAANKEIREGNQGRTTYVSMGEGGMMIRKHPAIGVAHEALRLALSFQSEFGLTPSSRTRVHAKATGGADEDEKFLFRTDKPDRR